MALERIRPIARPVEPHRSGSAAQLDQAGELSSTSSLSTFRRSFAAPCATSKASPANAASRSRHTSTRRSSSSATSSRSNEFSGLLDNAIKFAARPRQHQRPARRALGDDRGAQQTPVSAWRTKSCCLEGLAQGDPRRHASTAASASACAWRCASCTSWAATCVRSEPGKGTVVVVTLPSQPALNGKLHA